jgi:hypothetical protein
LPSLEKCHFASISFGLWLPKGACDVFALVITFLKFDWKPKHVIILGLFEDF